VAKTLSMDMRANDRAWLKLKLDVLAKTVGEASFSLPFPPHGEGKVMPGVVAAFAQVVRYRCEKLARSTIPNRIRCWTRCSASRSRRPAPTARCRGRWMSAMPPPARNSCWA
jgi:hypothetical protein